MDKKYIDRGKAMEIVKRTNGDYAAAWTEIRQLPAADVATVVHSRWIETKDQNKKRCGRCDVIHLIAQYPNGNANFCPNCGAKMDGGANGTA